MSVVIGKIQETLQELLQKREYSKIAVVTDKNTKRYCYPLIKDYLPKHIQISLQSGEEFKNLDNCTNIWNKLTEDEFDRHALVINLGGGVIGDMGGFAAATYKRGVDFYQVPTTLLAQVDASVGGKLGIDFHGFKNHIGVFTQPNSVLIDPVFLQTLPYRELKSGFAEIVKHCLIKDREEWEKIRRLDFDQMPFTDLIKHSVDIKKAVVQEDPTEKGLRKILNFGHTIGHAIETFYLNKNRLLHGEAIAVGMICESFISYSKGLLTEKELNDIEEFIYTIYGIENINKEDFELIAALTSQDKKNKGNETKAALLNGIGTAVYDVSITKNDIIKSLKYYKGI